MWIEQLEQVNIVLKEQKDLKNLKQDINEQSNREYPDREKKLAEWYNNLSGKELALFDIVAKKIFKEWQSAYKKEIDGGGVNLQAKGFIENLSFPGYSFSVSSDYRTPQRQFELFFGKDMVQNNNTVKQIPNFMPPEILNDNWTCKYWYETIYANVLKDYIDRAQYVSPPGYSEHHTGKAFDIKIKWYVNGEEREVMLWNTSLLPWDIHTKVASKLKSLWFRQTYSWESRHRYYTK